MKRLSYLLATMLMAVPLVFVSCGGDDDDDTDQPVQPVVTPTTTKKLTTGWYESGDAKWAMTREAQSMVDAGDSYRIEHYDWEAYGNSFSTAYHVINSTTIEGVSAGASISRPSSYFDTSVVSGAAGTYTLYFYYTYSFGRTTYTFDGTNIKLGNNNKLRYADGVIYDGNKAFTRNSYRGSLKYNY